MYDIIPQKLSLSHFKVEECLKRSKHVHFVETKLFEGALGPVWRWPEVQHDCSGTCLTLTSECWGAKFKGTSTISLKWRVGRCTYRTLNGLGLDRADHAHHRGTTFNISGSCVMLLAPNLKADAPNPTQKLCQTYYIRFGLLKRSVTRSGMYLVDLHVSRKIKTSALRSAR